jgi:hypothetical protein
MKIVFGRPPIAASDSALLVLNADVVVEPNKFLSTHGPLLKISTFHEPSVPTAIPVTANSAPPELFASAAGNDQA